MKRSVIVFLFALLSGNLFAQFSTEPTQFLKDIEKFLGAEDRTTTKEFMLEFEPNWLTNFSVDYQNRVMATSNLIVAKKLHAFPELYGYLLSAHSFVKTNQPTESFESWHNTIDQLLNSKNVRKFQEFIKVCEGFFTDGSIYIASNHIWRATGGTYTFQFEKHSPVIIFKDIKLACYIPNKSAGKREDPNFDSTIVEGTSGTYHPFTDQWIGRGGKMDWERVGFSSETDYAIITGYKMNLKHASIKTDTATVYTQYYPEPLQGSFSDEAKRPIGKGIREYPQFTSFSKEIIKKDILPGVDYQGGFSIKGEDFQGVGYGTSLATLIFYEDGEPRLRASATNFKVNNRGANALNCSIEYYLNDNQDTISHPGLSMKYTIDSSGKSMEMMRGKEGLSQAPFRNTYHKMDMYVDQLLWKVGNPVLEMTWHRGVTARRLAKFESSNYFSLKLYNDLQGMGGNHPLVAIYDYAYKHDLVEIPMNKLSGAMGMMNDDASGLLLILTNYGFVNYDTEKQMVTLNPKLKNYIHQRSGKMDYDHIVIYSNLQEIEYRDTILPNGRTDKQAVSFNQRAKAANKRKNEAPYFGIIDTKSLDMTLHEVEPIQLSPVQNTVIFPDEGTIVVKEGLDMEFGGAVMAGKLEAYVDAAKFDYSGFRINLIESEAVLFRVAPIFGGSDRLVPMASHFSKFEGYIQIDDTTNRSGDRDRRFHDYPKLVSNQDCFVYYNHPSIYNGVYDSSNFYFKVDKFTFDSLDNFDERTMKFDGEMRSAGIFPVFAEQISLQEDYSFGFKTKAPETGFDFYGDYAKFDNEIKMSNEGLRGAGEINFVTSTSISENFVFFPDSTMGMASFVNKAQKLDKAKKLPEFPDVHANGVMVTFVPKQEILKARAVDEPLMFFEDESYMKGITYLTPEGMTGRGLMYFKDAELGSKKFVYGHHTIDSDTCDFNLEDVGHTENDGLKNPLSFDSRNLNGHVDFEERKAEFRRNDGTKAVDFPKNQYVCFMDMFTWYMDKDEVELSQDETASADVTIETGVDMAQSNFFSYAKGQDSLDFKAPKAIYVLKKDIIYCDKVEYIDVGDARIYPADQKVTIHKKAEMDPFVGAKIEAPRVEKSHTIDNADVTIKGKYKYNASGDYPYKDSKGEIQLVHFADVHLDTAFQTVANGDIPLERNFHLSDRFDYYGGIELKANDPFLMFDGATRIRHNCDLFAKNWLKFRSLIDPNNIQIPVSQEMTDLEGNPIAVGLVRPNHHDYDSLEIYPTFLSQLRNPTDFVMFSSWGVLNYNEEAKEFRISSPEKLINRADTGNYVALHVESCSMEGDGLIDLNLNLPDVDFKTYGTINYNTATRETAMNLSGGLNFFCDEKIMKIIEEDITGTEGITGIDFRLTTLEQAIKEESGETAAENIKSDYVEKGAANMSKLPKEMRQTIYMTNLRMKWSQRSHCLISEPITGIVSFYGEPLYRDFTVRLVVQYFNEVTMDGKQTDYGTRMGYMIEIPGEEKPGNYYFFWFKRNKKKTELEITTSNAELKNYILLLKDDKRKEKDFSFEFKKPPAKGMEEFNGIVTGG